MKKSFVLAFVFIIISSSAIWSAPTETYRRITPGSLPRLPAAFYFMKDYKIQWWYFTGHLYDADGREFGYQLTFFVVGIQKRHFRSKFGVNNVYIEHFAVSDPSHNKFIFTDNSDSGAFGLSGAKENSLKVWTETASLLGPPQHMRIRAVSGAGANETALDLALSPEKPVILNGDGGYSRKSGQSPLDASFYFSYSRLKTEGTLTLNGSAVPVNGESWFDREISSYPRSKSSIMGWDWFAIQLDDQREIMLYQLRNKDGSIDPFSSGTLVYAGGRYRHLRRDDFSINVLRYYVSAKTGARYPAEWEIKIPSEQLALRVIPLIEDQELIATATTGNHYWEGACRVLGTARGHAYAELTGY